MPPLKGFCFPWPLNSSSVGIRVVVVVVATTGVICERNAYYCGMYNNGIIYWFPCNVE